MFIRQEGKDNIFKVVDAKSTQVVKSVKPGLYNLEIQHSMFFGTSIYIERNDRYANSTPINTGVYGETLSFIDKFMSTDMFDIRDEMGMMHKVGMIFNGKIGTGKTFLAGQIAEKLAKEHNALALIMKGEPDIPLHALVDTMRVEDPDRLIVLILDEYEKHNNGNDHMLHFLDGKDSRNNVIVIATVNTTTGIPKEIKDRRGRIEKIFNFTVKSKDVVKRIIENVLPDKYKKYISMDGLVQEAMKNDSLLKIDNLTIRIRDMIYDGIRAEMNKPKVAKQSKAA